MSGSSAVELPKPDRKSCLTECGTRISHFSSVAGSLGQGLQQSPLPKTNNFLNFNFCGSYNTQLSAFLNSRVAPSEPGHSIQGHGKVKAGYHSCGYVHLKTCDAHDSYYFVLCVLYIQLFSAVCVQLSSVAYCDRL